MANSARVDSIDTLKAFRVALIKFAEVATTSLTDAEGEMHRVMGWLERDQASYWQSQLRKHAELVTRAKEAVRMKKLFKGPDGRPASAVEEEKALAIAMKRFAEAEQRAKAVAVHTRKLPKEILMYKGQVQRFATSLSSEVPLAVAKLGQLVTTLEAYVSLAAGGAGGADGGPLITAEMAGIQSMTRAEGFAAGQAWEALRGQVPAGQERSNAPAAPADSPPLATPTLTSAESEAFAAIPGPREAFDPESRIVLAAACASSPRVFLVRTDLSFPGDSGWYAGVTDPSPTAAAGSAIALVSLRMADLLASRPDLKDFLTLPAGYLIVLDGGGVSAVLDPADREIWKTPAPVAPPTEGAAQSAPVPAAPAGAVP